jgi:hypothetical protein
VKIFVRLLQLRAFGSPTSCIQTHSTKTITVHRDAAGNITGTTEIERDTQPGGSLKRIRFEHLDGYHDE